MVSGSRPVSEEDSMRLSMDRSYGTSAAGVEGRMGMLVHILVLIMALMTAGTGFAQAPAKPLKMVVLGDSLSAGLGLASAMRPCAPAWDCGRRRRFRPACKSPCKPRGYRSI